MEVSVAHNAAASRFEVVIGGQLSRADYRLDGVVMRMMHTEVPPALQGRGIAAALVRSALGHARDNGLRIVPACSYVRAYMRRHPETRSLLADGYGL